MDGRWHGALAVARQVSDLFSIDASVSVDGQGDRHARYECNVTRDFSHGAFPRWILNAGLGWHSPAG
jgi:hypothetical protein